MPGGRGGGASSDSDRLLSGCQGLKRILLLRICGRFVDVVRTMTLTFRTPSARPECRCGPVLTALVVFSPMVVNSRPTRPATLGASTTIVWKT
jgi:hypothetical protein